MKMMLSWRIPTGNYKACVEAFLDTGAPDGEGMTTIGRWHAPGSAYGWHLVEGDENAISEHVGGWAALAEIETTPVLDDEAAAAALSRAFGR